mgnify:CR=1 FL=1|tara:strand:+ start:2041 stop:2880 length:840 start_codon:yes stop_codon:yes gene_type:complete
MSNTATIHHINKGQRSMPSERGFIGLWRDIDKQPWYNLHKGRYTAVFIHLLISASHKPVQVVYRGQNITLMPGQLAKSFSQLAKELNQTKSDIQNAINTFKKYGQISTHSDGKLTVISIKKWSKFNTVGDTGCNTPEPHTNRGLEGKCNTANNTVSNTQNNNDLNNNKELVSKDTCQNSDEFSPTKQQKVPHQEIINLFGEILPALPQPKKLTPARQKAIRARHINDLKSKIENWRRYFTYIRDNCSWMTSGNYNVDFDYVIRQSTFVKVLEGAKDDRG